MTCLAQEYVYKHYDLKDGLANSSVYHMLQDKNGFMWFATAGGVSRFDGTHFKTFTTQDGLPINFTIRMFEDSRGRIWLMHFKNSICYYYKGKIHNQQNDSALKKIQLEDFVRSIAENKRKEILLTDSKKIYHIDEKDEVKLIDQKIMGSALVTQLSVREWGDFFIAFDKRVFSTDTKTFRYLQNIPNGKSMQHLVVHDKVTCWMDLNTLYVKSSYYKKSYKELIGSVNTMQLQNDSILCLNTAAGTIFYNLLQQKIEKNFLPNGNVSYCIKDKEGGYWFSTLNDGVFRLGSLSFKTITGKTAAGQKLGVYYLEKFNDEIWGGCDMGHLMKIKNNAASFMQLTVGKEGVGNHIVYAVSAKENHLAAACGEYIFIKGKDDQFKYEHGFGSSKDMVWKNDTQLIVGSSHSLYSLHIDKPGQNAMYRAGRVICLYYRNDSTWFGTFDGLYIMKPDSGIVYMGKNIPLLAAPVTCIKEGLDGTIWLGTVGSGVVGLQNNIVTRHFDKMNGLNSDRVRCIDTDSSCIWVGTEKDLNKIPLQSNSSITRYPYSDELNADVRSILVDKNIIYVGSADGVTLFDKRDTISYSVPYLKIEGVFVNEKERELQPHYLLPYSNNSIRFDFVAISMKTSGNIIYHYRLSGLDTNWKSTTQNSIEFISLPPGEYMLELFAKNNSGIKSQSYHVTLVVQYPFWQSTGFIVTAALFIALIAWFIGSLHNTNIIKKEKARRFAEQQLLDLEQKALRAQMNPHFIFNCLNSIQSFILDNEAENANKYLSRFASLIRQTLENSLQSSVSLADEIKYLGTYLQLEQMRSESKFEYYIETEEGLSTQAVSIPVMVLQPFVENAVRHGVQSVNGRSGLINIYFSVRGEELVCRIEDNGIGRQQALLQKNTGPTVYRSRGMQLTYERIDLINTNSAKKITVEIVDKLSDCNESNGTDVIIRFPIFASKDPTLS
jgi:ligand-binding sensor domain-containing protein/two-component sensor histidine kinase